MPSSSPIPGVGQSSAKLVGRDVVLSVADNGIGIAEADLPKLGKPFVQANNSYDRNDHARVLDCRW